MKPTEENQDLFLEEYRFLTAVNSTNPEEGSDNQDNQRLIRVPVSVSTDWRVTGTSKPAQVEYNISQEIPDKYYFEDELGEEIFHVYDVKNRGPSTIQEADVFILWPSNNENGDPSLVFRYGFHAVPSMNHLHMHVISQDFDSPCLKHKKHWNSFTTTFFVPLEELKIAITKGEEIDFSYRQNRLHGGLKCHRCGKVQNNIPQLKQHICGCNYDPTPRDGYV